MRTMLMLVGLSMVVVACSSKAELEAERKADLAAIEAADNSKCVNFGFERGTQNYFQCRMQVEQTRESADAARKAAALQYLLGQQRQQQQVPSLGTQSTTNCYLIGNTMNCTTR